MAHRGSRGIALPFLDNGTRRGWGVSVTPRPLFTPGKDPVPVVQEAGWATGPGLTDAENLTPTGIRSPDRPAHSQSLYRLSYPGPLILRSVIYSAVHNLVSHIIWGGRTPCRCLRKRAEENIWTWEGESDRRIEKNYVIIFLICTVHKILLGCSS